MMEYFKKRYGHIDLWNSNESTGTHARVCLKQNINASTCSVNSFTTAINQNLFYIYDIICPACSLFRTGR